MRPTCKLCGAVRRGTHSTYCTLCYNEYKRYWYLKNRTKEIARSAKWNKKNAEAVAANMRACRARRPEHFKKYQAEYRQKNPEKMRLIDRNKLARRRVRTRDGRVSKEDWEQIVKRFRWRCIYCGKKPKALTMDHFVPISKGGKHEPGNVVPACFSCNSKKQAILPDDFARRMGVLFWV